MDDLTVRFDAQRAAFRRHPWPDAAERYARLMRLKRLILSHQDAIAEALDADFGGRSANETRYAEVLPSVLGLNHALAQLSGWMKPRRRRVPLMFQPATSALVPQPVGVVGIMVPWNYALYLAVGPLTSALAAGNHCMVKLSEFTPRFAALFAGLIEDAFDPAVISVVGGEVEVARAFAALPFDHLLFTGSTAVGRRVMAAAAPNLTPVTLELGGKSPVYLDPGMPVDEAARRLVFAKCLNAGQTCVAPDYILCPPDAIDAFVAAFRAEVGRQYGDPASNPDYSRIINARQQRRLLELLRAAEAEGATLHWAGSPPDPADERARLPPVLLTGVAPDSAVMQEELFGPILPVLPCASETEARAFINDRPRPLALYVFTHDRSLRRRFVQGTHSGGLVINDALFHFGIDNLPVGGIGASGMGRYHGRDGFETFSHLKPVVAKGRWSSLKLAYPPYGRRIHRLIEWLFVR